VGYITNYGTPGKLIDAAQNKTFFLFTTAPLRSYVARSPLEPISSFPAAPISST